MRKIVLFICLFYSTAVIAEVNPWSLRVSGLDSAAKFRIDSLPQLMLPSTFASKPLRAQFATPNAEWIEKARQLNAAGSNGRPIAPTGLKALKAKSKPLVAVSKYIRKPGPQYEGYTLGLLGAYGFLTNNEKLKSVTLRASEAYLTAAVADRMYKFFSGRDVPSNYDPRQQQYGNQNYDRSQRPKITQNLFTGSASTAFAVAGIYANAYKDKKYLPVCAYAAATLVGLSGIKNNEYWASDLITGAVFGYMSARSIQKKYTRIVDPEKTGFLTQVHMNMTIKSNMPIIGFTYRPKR